MSQQVALHLECTDLVATTFDDVNAAAAPDPIHTIFVDRGVSWNTSSYKEWSSMNGIRKCGGPYIYETLFLFMSKNRFINIKKICELAGVYF